HLAPTIAYGPDGKEYLRYCAEVRRCPRRQLLIRADALHFDKHGPLAVPAPQLVGGPAGQPTPLHAGHYHPVRAALGDRVVPPDARFVLPGQPLPEIPPSERVPPEGFRID